MIDKHKLQLAVIDGYIEHAEKDGYSTQVTLHALNLMKKRYTELLEERENLRMLSVWASKLVGNKGAFDHACKQWHESHELLIDDLSATKVNV